MCDVFFSLSSNCKVDLILSFAAIIILTFQIGQLVQLSLVQLWVSLVVGRMDWLFGGKLFLSNSLLRIDHSFQMDSLRFRRILVREVIEKCMRLSFHSKLSEFLPPEFESILPEEPTICYVLDDGSIYKS